MCGCFPMDTAWIIAKHIVTHARKAQGVFEEWTRQDVFAKWIRRREVKGIKRCKQWIHQQGFASRYCYLAFKPAKRIAAAESYRAKRMKAALLAAHPVMARDTLKRPEQ